MTRILGQRSGMSPKGAGGAWKLPGPPAYAGGPWWLLAGDVHALCGVAVSAGMVVSAVGDSGDGFDTKIAVVVCGVAGDGCGGAVDVDSVVSGAGGEIALEQRVDDWSHLVGVDGDAIGACCV